MDDEARARRNARHWMENSLEFLDNQRADLGDLLAQPPVQTHKEVARKVALARTNVEQGRLWLADALADLKGATA